MLFKFFQLTIYSLLDNISCLVFSTYEFIFGVKNTSGYKSISSKVVLSLESAYLINYANFFRNEMMLLYLALFISKINVGIICEEKLKNHG